MSENNKLESWLKFIIDPNSLEEKELDENEALKMAKEEYDKIIAEEHEKSLTRLRKKYGQEYDSTKNASSNSENKNETEAQNKTTEKRMEQKKKKAK